MEKMAGDIVIVGNGSAALAALEWAHKTDPGLEILVLSDEDSLPYSPTALPYYFAGRIQEQHLFLRKDSFYAEQNATLLRGRAVTRVLPGQRQVLFEDGRTVTYRNLLIATGGTPIIPPIEGLDRVPFHVFRTLKDAKELIGVAGDKAEAIVLGGGLVGMETASGLIKRGLKVTVVEREDRILPLYFDREAGAIISQIYRQYGVELVTGQPAVEVTPFPGDRIGVTLADGRKLTTQILVVATGMRPNVELLQGSGVRVNRGVAVDDRMCTNIPEIFAAGDVAEGKGFFDEELTVNAILPDAVEQGRIAGINMAGGEERYHGGLSLNIFNFFGHAAFSCGLALVEGDNFRIIKKVAPGGERYRKLVFKGGVLVGALLIDEAIDPGIIHSFIKKRLDLSDYLGGLEQDLLNVGRLAMIRSGTPTLPEGV